MYIKLNNHDIIESKVLESKEKAWFFFLGAFAAFLPFLTVVLVLSIFQ